MKKFMIAFLALTMLTTTVTVGFAQDTAMKGKKKGKSNSKKKVKPATKKDAGK